jgi:hypothetical protein
MQTFEPSGFMLMSFAAFEAPYLHSSRVFRHGMLFVQSESEKPSAQCASDKQHFKDVRKTTLDFYFSAENYTRH